jgi:hypothetical protein
MVILDGLETLFTREFPRAYAKGCYRLLQQSNPVSNPFLSSVRALGKYCFVKISASPFCCTDFLRNDFNDTRLAIY